MILHRLFATKYLGAHIASSNSYMASHQAVLGEPLLRQELLVAYGANVTARWRWRNGSRWRSMCW